MGSARQTSLGSVGGLSMAAPSPPTGAAGPYASGALNPFRGLSAGSMGGGSVNGDNGSVPMPPPPAEGRRVRADSELSYALAGMAGGGSAGYGQVAYGQAAYGQAGYVTQLIQPQQQQQIPQQAAAAASRGTGQPAPSGAPSPSVYSAAAVHDR
jgi:hypothetical protein